MATFLFHFLTSPSTGWTASAGNQGSQLLLWSQQRHLCVFLNPLMEVPLSEVQQPKEATNSWAAILRDWAFSYSCSETSHMSTMLAVNRLFCTRMASMPRTDNAACAALHISTFSFTKKIKLKISVSPIWFGEKNYAENIRHFLFLQFWFDCCCLNSKDGRATACATFLVRSEPFAVAASIARMEELQPVLLLSSDVSLLLLLLHR